MTERLEIVDDSSTIVEKKPEVEQVKSSADLVFQQVRTVNRKLRIASHRKSQTPKQVTTVEQPVERTTEVATVADAADPAHNPSYTTDSPAVVEQGRPSESILDHFFEAEMND